MPPRVGFLSSPGKGEVSFLGQRANIKPPVDWDAENITRDRHLWLFHLHYMEYIEEMDAADLQATVGDWIDCIPPFRVLDDHAWHPFVTSIRSVVWMQRYAESSGDWTSAFRTRFLNSLASQLRSIYQDPELDLGGNHLIKNIKALLWGSRFFDGFESVEWSEWAVEKLAVELDEQVLSDGMHFERSPAYHCQVFVDLLECWICLDEGELKEAVRSRLRAMAQAITDLTHPDDRISLMNDGGLNMAYRPAECLEAYRRHHGSVPHQRPVFRLDRAGYYGLRRGNDLFLADAGPIGPDHNPAHGHSDIFTFEWSVDGNRVIVDPGGFVYESGVDRDYSRSTRAHNTVTLDGLNQSEMWGAFRVGRRARPADVSYSGLAGGFMLEGAHDGYTHLKGRPIHRRRFRVTADEIQVVDQVEGGAGQFVESRILLHPECSCLREGERLIITRGASKLQIVSSAPIRLEEATYSPDLGQLKYTSRVVMEYGSAPCEGSFTITKQP